MSVFREAEIEWNGEKYRFTPNMAFLREIENEVSIMHVAHAVHRGQPRVSHMAFIVATAMRHSGAAVSEDELAAEFMTGDTKKVMSLYEGVMQAITPSAPKKKDNEE
jgi:hypothetical protein